MGGVYVVVPDATRIISAIGGDQSGEDDGNVIDWVKGDDFSLAVLIGTSKGPLARTYKLRFRDATADEAFADVSTSGATDIHYDGVNCTNFNDGDDVVTLAFKCQATPEPTAQTGLASELDNTLPDAGFFTLLDEQYTEFWWGLGCDNATDEHEYEFELWDTTEGLTCGTLGATITMVAAAGPQTIPMVAVTLASSPQALDLSLGAISVEMQEATLASSLQALVVSAPPPAQTIAMVVATLVSSPQTLDVIPGAVEVVMHTIFPLASLPQALTVVTGAVAVPMSASTLVSSAQAIESVTSVPPAQSITMSAVTLASSTQGLSVVAGAVSISLSEATLVSAPQSLAVVSTAPITISMGVITLASSGQGLVVTVGAVSISLGAVTLASSPQTLSVLGIGSPQTITLGTITLASTSQGISVITAQIIVLQVITLTSTAEQMDVQPGSVIAPMQAVTLASSVQSASILIGVTAVQMQAVTLSASPQSFDILAGSATIQMGVATLTLTPQSLGVIFIVSIIFERNLSGSRDYDVTLEGSI